jgi:pimeloyl-ACP methyl ester carboxylesterase
MLKLSFGLAQRIPRYFPAIIGFALLAGCGSDRKAPDPSTPPEKPIVVRTGEVPSADGALIRYEVRGEGVPALVFIHGWCCDRRYWQPQLDHFARSNQVVAMDLAGHGESNRGTRTEWTMAAFGADVAAVVNHLDLQQVVLVGHSMGGPVMLEAAPLLDNRVVALVGVDCFNDPNEHFTPEQMAEFRKPFETDFAKAMSHALQHEQDFFTPRTKSSLIKRIVAGMSSAPADIGLGAFQGMLDFANDRQRPLLSAVKVPLTCVNTRIDPENLRAGKQLSPHFDIISPIPEAGHFLMMEYPDQFNRVLEEVLAK